MSNIRTDRVADAIDTAVTCAQALVASVSDTDRAELARGQRELVTLDLPARLVSTMRRVAARATAPQTRALIDVLIMAPSALTGWQKVVLFLGCLTDREDGWDQVQIAVEDLLWYPFQLHAFFNSDHLVALIDLAYARLAEMYPERDLPKRWW